MRFGFIGFGNMATAIVQGALHSGAYAPEDIGVYDKSEGAQKRAADLGCKVCASVEALVQESERVVLAVKPQVLPSVLPLLKTCLGNRGLVSIAAGKTLAFYAEALGQVRMVRVMPNINAVALAATSAICPNENATAEDVAAVRALFETVGTVSELPESQMATFAAIAGASPAFSYIYIDALARAAVRAGMPRDAALSAAASAVYGSAKLVMQSAEHPHLLADRVCSPGGTTIEGVHILKCGGFEGLVEDAVDAVIQKDKSL